MTNVKSQGRSATNSSSKSRFDLSDRDFQFIVKFIGDHAGIVMNDAKRDLIYGRLAPRLRALKLTNFSDYCHIIKSGDQEETERFINALTTNLTSFFREQHHFDFLKKELIPQLVRTKASPVIRAWSAGCSTGEEPYSIAMSVAEVLPPGWEFNLLATDLDTNVVNTAAKGIYKLDRVEGLSKALLKRWFHRGTGANEGKVKVVPELQQFISFKQLNLLSDWPMKGSFDFIFCRNVVIYFDKSTQQVLFDRFAQQLERDNHLFIGHSETLNKVSDRFSLIGNTIYQRDT